VSRHILTLLLILFIGVPTALAKAWRPQPPVRLAEPFTHYLPLVQYIPGQPNLEPLEVVETARGEIEGYPTYYYLYGYVRNLTSEPIYDVVLDLEVTICPYSGEDPPPPCETGIVQMRPALTATLTNQINPFGYSMMLGKASGSIGPIVNVSYGPWTSGESYYSLTILDYEYQAPYVTGTLHNDSGHPLHAARVVMLEPVNCGRREATLGLDTLMPGEETTFSARYGASCGVNDHLFISGQGAFQPWILP
jgi:hypothetical protein